MRVFIAAATFLLIAGCSNSSGEAVAPPSSIAKEVSATSEVQPTVPIAETVQCLPSGLSATVKFDQGGDTSSFDELAEFACAPLIEELRLECQTTIQGFALTGSGGVGTPDVHPLINECRIDGLDPLFNDLGAAVTVDQYREWAWEIPLPDSDGDESGSRVAPEDVLKAMLELDGVDGAGALSSSEVRSMGESVCKVAGRSVSGRDFSVALATSWQGSTDGLAAYLRFGGAAAGVYCPDEADRLGI